MNQTKKTNIAMESFQQGDSTGPLDCHIRERIHKGLYIQIPGARPLVKLKLLDNEEEEEALQTKYAGA